MDYKEIKITKDQVVLVDDIDFDWLNQWKWSDDGRGYAVRAVTVGKKRRKAIRMHRLIVNAPEDSDVDHIDGNPLNNCRSNLRICTRTQNLANASKRTNGTSKYKGVHWNKKASRWAACVSKSGDRKFIGFFKEEVDAATAYNLVAAEYFGEYARFNRAP